MNWENGRRSENIEDRRGGGGGRLVLGGGATLVVVVVCLLLGVNPSQILGGGDESASSSPRATGGSGSQRADPHEERLKQFASVVLADTEDTWPALLQARGIAYEQPHLVLFSGGVESTCGFAQSAMGPFYCPRDHKVYLDLEFFDELSRKLGAPGDFAQAYVIAHEIGHHVQTLLGTTRKVEAMRGRERGADSASVKVELQADCYAGVWANHAQKDRKILEPGDLEEALGAAAAVGDDTLQRRASGHVVPETFTHGSAAQRASWFKRGLQEGTLEACDTFGGR